MPGGTGRHDSDPIKLLKIYQIFAEWLAALREREVEIPVKNADELISWYDKIKDKRLGYEKEAEDNSLWPVIVYGPKTLASDHYHTVLLILDEDTTPEQEQYVSKRFFNLMKWSWTRHDDILEPEWIKQYLEPMAAELKDKGLTRIQ